MVMEMVMVVVMMMMVVMVMLGRNLALLVVFRIENADLLPLKLKQTVGVNKDLEQQG